MLASDYTAEKIFSIEKTTEMVKNYLWLIRLFRSNLYIFPCFHQISSWWVSCKTSRHGRISLIDFCIAPVSAQHNIWSYFVFLIFMMSSLENGLYTIQSDRDFIKFDLKDLYGSQSIGYPISHNYKQSSIVLPETLASYQSLHQLTSTFSTYQVN